MNREKLENLTEEELNGLLKALMSEQERRAKLEENKIIDNLQNALVDFARKVSDAVYIDVWCEECEQDIEVNVSEYFYEIIEKLGELKG